MIKHQLIDRLIKKQPNMEPKDVVLAADCIIESIIQALMKNDRVEIRGFGSFSLHYHPPCIGRNPLSGTKLNLPARYLPYFKPGKALRQAVDLSKETCRIK